MARITIVAIRPQHFFVMAGAELVTGKRVQTMNCLNDDKFGPFVVGCRDDFDFTKTFEQLALSIAPNAFFIILAAARITKLTKTSGRVRAPFLLLAKTLSALALFGLHGAYLTGQIVNSHHGGRYSLLAAALATMSAAVLILCSRMAHARMDGPSDAITIFLFASVVCEAVQLRTHCLSSAPVFLTGCFAAITACTCLLLVVELASKSTRTAPTGVWKEPKRSRSALSKVFLWWLNDLVRYTYRHEIGPDDLGPLDEKGGGNVPKPIHDPLPHDTM
ncbi:multidrug resistance protein, putative [Cordyceps militaris CM01]|uniref:Multidrug resistance protein, putative n=1 Tax=Cordyceps militaris (strain CM01) TaxID=983644 RepID=G3JLX9_CORMM|nr:multidrug resistance protein, putative [Cordyceps militaris CM01]EGX90703.1 multidrug resistance protein, putative [Cordyceps militaris CM01]